MSNIGDEELFHKHVPDVTLSLPRYRKMDTMLTRLPVPEIHLEHPDFPDMWNENMIGQRRLFYTYIEHYGIRGLAYSAETWAALEYLDDLDDTILPRIALELMPCHDNPDLQKRHGAVSTYVSGCHGPLCGVANTQYNRNRKGKEPRDSLIMEKEMGLELVISSQNRFREYMQQTRAWRATFDDDMMRRHSESPDSYRTNWKRVSLRETFLLEFTRDIYSPGPARNGLNYVFDKVGGTLD